MTRRLPEILVGVSALVGLGILANSAFSPPVRRKILERDGHKCVLCGATDHLEAAHINHDKTNPRYDDESNGRTLCTEHHLTDHINRHGSNGLNKHANEWAIEMIKQRLP